jgi:signal transduction histidine kinase
LKLKQADESKPFIDKAYTLAIKMNQTNNLKQSYAKYFNYYMQKGNTDLAESFFDKYNQMRDSVLNSDVTHQITEMGTKYETEKKEQENLLLKKDNKIKSLTLWFLAIGLFLATLTFYLIYNRNKLKQNALLQAERLKQQELRSKAVLEAEETERQRIAKDLHDGIGQMLSAVKLNLSSVQHRITIDEKENLLFQNAITLVDDSVKEVRSISHNMMPNMLIKKGLANAVRDFIDKLSGTTLKIDLEITGMNERLETSLESIIFRVLQELVNNIIKHANANHITLQLLRFENELTIMIEDNGVGFNVDETLNSDKGIGLKNIISRIEFLKGNIHYDSTIGKGTTVTIDIPLDTV